ncbi:MAG: phosphoribosyltransferase [Candidatus Asgardarchaeia archaeon]
MPSMHLNNELKQKVIYDESLYNKLHVFRDRYHAGEVLAKRLEALVKKDALILAIPAGGVPVGTTVAKKLRLPFDLIIVRKMQIPYDPEAGFGAVGPDGSYEVNKRILQYLSLSDDDIKKIAEKTYNVIKQRMKKYRGNKPLPNISGRTVILVDDGLASGYTMYMAVKWVKRQSPKKIIVAVPTAPYDTVVALLKYVDLIVCLNIRRMTIFAVADAYKKWYDVNDEEVFRCLREVNFL